ncbi:MAG: excisionase family DNA-binding protein [Planctomycetota bacterium]|nr:excisionase family DNA-binding protein [Planctomycetota bacterium]
MIPEPTSNYIGLATLVGRTGLSARTVRKWVHAPERPMPAYRVGGKFLFKWVEVEAWLASHRVQPVSVSEHVDAIMESFRPR